MIGWTQYKNNTIYNVAFFQFQYFNIPNFDWFASLFSSKLVIGAVANVTADPGAFPFHGSISCFQIFSAALNPAQIKYKSKCSDASNYQSSPCPSGYQLYDGICISVSIINRFMLSL